ncbi:hypothetical protein D9756_003102 [Leucocoprinus leucothites]|uniref:Rho-GAP domain-containing protein n=1 Tax=Leucocoprinus leucothites TaxID=201217 RepID=A0A8H5G7I4_9AGAR|nr:hypothetical protein D9756_003102 [Leucoagaricus leucothites]
MVASAVNQSRTLLFFSPPLHSLAFPSLTIPSPTPARKFTALFAFNRRRKNTQVDSPPLPVRTALAQGDGVINNTCPSPDLLSSPSQQPHTHPTMLSAHPQSPHLHPPPPQPTKASLKAWWNHFTFVQRAKKEPSYVREYEKGSAADHPVFGKPLVESLKYASVPISTANQTGDLYVWGYVPVVVAKCGLYLKENATEVPGTFRVNGSNKRMRELQQQFETPPKYGKNLDWKQETYTTHDVASVFRRYLTQMPVRPTIPQSPRPPRIYASLLTLAIFLQEPVIPHRLYHNFRDALVYSFLSARAPHNQDAVIAEYKALIRQMSQAHQYLLLYVLDLLSVFARKSDKNLMTAQNLAVIFRPGILSHPSHEMLPAEHALSQQVLEFLIANQDWFMLDTPAPNPSLVSPPLSNSNPTTTQAPTSHSAPLHHPSPPSAYINRGASPTPHTTTASGGIGIHWRGVSSDREDEKGWKSAGVPMMTEKEIQREQERIKMMRRRTTLERGEPGIYGTLEEPNMDGDSPTTTSYNNPILSTGPVSVVRSRTLPSSRSRRGGPGESGGATESNPNVNVATNTPATATEKKEERERSRLLKKQKRASMVTPSQASSSNERQAQRRTSQIMEGSSA